MLRTCLDDLEQRITPSVEDELLAEWKKFATGTVTTGIFSPQRRQQAPATISWPEININDAIEDVELMALDQFSECSKILDAGSGHLMNVRCNYGTGIMASLFGAELFIMPRETNTLPTTRPITGGKDAIKALIDRGVPDIHQALGAKVFEMREKFVDMMRDYPNIKRYVHLYHPDLQGPIDTCELLWGSSLFVDLVDEPDLVKDFLGLITETYITFMKKWLDLVPASSNSVHWSFLHKGALMLRDDSAMNMSSRMFKKFIEPCDQRLLDTFNGGAIHFCGRGDHYIPHISTMNGVFAVQLSQPEYNDMEKIFTYTIDNGIKLLGLPRDAAEQAVQQGRELYGRVHCW